MLSSSPQSVTSRPAPALRPNYRWELLAWFFCTFLLYYGDRAIYGVVLGAMGQSLGLPDSTLGFVNTVMFAGIALLMPMAGFAGDHWSRKRVVIFSLAAWSLGTLFTGLVTGLVALVLCRSILTGCGEAFYSPSAYSLLGQHHVRTRSLAMGIHQMSLYVGVIASGVVGGWFATRYGWRAAFVVFGGAGLILAGLLAWRLAPDPRTSTGAGRAIGAMLESLRLLVTTPSALAFCLSFSAIVCVINAYITWAPRLLSAKFGLSGVAAGANAMLWHHLAAMVTVLLGGWLSDRWSARRREARVVLMALSMLCAAPGIYYIGAADSALATYVAMALFGVFRGLYECNTHASLFEVVPERTRATAVAVFVMVAFVVGSCTPWIFGTLADKHGPAVGLSLGFKAIAGLFVLGGATLLVVWRTVFLRDAAAADAVNATATPTSSLS